MVSSRTTKLQAVNTMLQTIGESSTNTITGSVPYEVSLAEDILDEIVRALCQDSYVFNTEEDVSLSPDVSNNISVHSNYVQVRAADEEYVIRDNGGSPILYSMRDKSSTFQNDITVEVVYLLDFEDLPEAAKRYCTIRAARIYADRLVGSQDIRVFSAQDEVEARAKLNSFVHAIGKVNMLNDSSSVRNVLNRQI